MGMQKLSISDLKGKDIEKAIESSDSEDSSESCSSDGSQGDEGQGCWCGRNCLILAILCICNLLNYMDRYTIAGVLTDIQSYYGISNAQAGLLQTSFICSYMVLSPVFGYLGDRYNRKLIMAVGIFFWSTITLAGSFVPQNMFWLFMVLRGMVGIGEASYSTIAPTIIADLFIKDTRSTALAFFYFAIPVGSGLGYIVGAQVAQALGSWYWALRVTPAMGVICLFLIVTVVKEPVRGAVEGAQHLRNTSWCKDLAYLVKNKSFMMSTFGFTTVAFVAGAFSLWVPAYMEYAVQLQGRFGDVKSVSLIFGIITCLAGLLGVALGSGSAKKLRKINPRADPLVCAFGLIACVPFLFAGVYISRYNIVATWIFIFLGETLLCLNWAIVTDIQLYIVIPTRRSTAAAFQILVSHALGDASSPYLIGVISDAVMTARGNGSSIGENFLSLQYALYVPMFISVIGGGFFLATALFVQEDKSKLDIFMKAAIQNGRQNGMVNGQMVTVVDVDGSLEQGNLPQNPSQEALISAANTEEGMA